MKVEQVIETLDTLARGEGQPPEVVQALQAAIVMLHRRAGLRWTPEEDERLVREFDAGMPLPEIAREHKRTRGAIAARLVMMGRLDAETAGVRMRVRERLAS